MVYDSVLMKHMIAFGRLGDLNKTRFPTRDTISITVKIFFHLSYRVLNRGKCVIIPIQSSPHKLGSSHVRHQIFSKCYFIDLSERSCHT